MEMERINEDTIRVVVTNEDLAERSISVVDLLGNQEEIEHFFYNILEEVDVDHDFENNEAVTFQVLPNRNGLEVFISKNLDDKEMMNGMMSSMLGNRDIAETNDAVSDDLLEKLLDRDGGEQEKIKREVKESVEQTTVGQLLDEVQNKRQNPATTPHVMVKFADFEDMINFAKMATNIPAKTTLYEKDSEYYLEFLFSSGTTQSDVQDIMAVAREYGEVSPVSPEVLLEHGKLIFDTHALASINQYFK